MLLKKKTLTCPIIPKKLSTICTFELWFIEEPASLSMVKVNPLEHLICYLVDADYDIGIGE